MFKRTIEGVILHFHLAGINNQNFLMRDEQTGTYWQQITGLAIAGPLAGRKLERVAADELSFALWKKEQPQGTVLQDQPRFTSEYAAKDWDDKMARTPTVLSYAQPGLKARDIMLGLHVANLSRAYPYATVLKAGLIDDQVGPEPIVLVVGPDQRSVRVFSRHIPGASAVPQFYRSLDSTGGRSNPEVAFIDGQTASGWNFQGCALNGPLKGVCLKQLEVIKDYWFDWRHYNSDTTVYGISRNIR